MKSGVLSCGPGRGGAAQPVVDRAAKAVVGHRGEGDGGAIGARVGSLPITPARVLAALGKVPPSTALAP